MTWIYLRAIQFIDGKRQRLYTWESRCQLPCVIPSQLNYHLFISWDTGMEIGQPCRLFETLGFRWNREVGSYLRLIGN